MPIEDDALYPNVYNVDVKTVTEENEKIQRAKKQAFLELSEHRTLVVDPRTGKRSERSRTFHDGTFYMQIQKEKEKENNEQSSESLLLGGFAGMIRRLKIKSCIKRTKDKLIEDVRSVIGCNVHSDTMARISRISASERQGQQDKIPKIMRFIKDGYFKSRMILQLLNQLYIRPGVIMERSEQQIELHQALLGSVLPIIFGDDWSIENRRAPELLGLVHEDGSCDIKRDVLITAPRQFGKTTGVASFVAVFAAVVMSENVLIVSNQLDQCKNMLDRVYGFMEHMPILHRRVKMRISSLCITVKHGRGTTNENTVIFAKKDVRGTSTRFIVADEMAYIKKSDFDPVIPLLGVDKTSFVGISTVHKDNRNFFNRLVSGKTGMDFRVIKILAGVCSRCKKDDPGATKCIHALIARPKWKSTSREKKVEGILKDDKNAFMVEAMGVMTDQTEYAFKKNNIDALMDVSRSFRNISGVTIRRAFVGVDPTGGGSSEIGICTVAEFPGGQSNQFIVRFADMVSRQPFTHIPIHEIGRGGGRMFTS